MVSRLVQVWFPVIAWDEARGVQRYGKRECQRSLSLRAGVERKYRVTGASKVLGKR